MPTSCCVDRKYADNTVVSKMMVLVISLFAPYRRVALLFCAVINIPPCHTTTFLPGGDVYITPLYPADDDSFETTMNGQMVTDRTLIEQVSSFPYCRRHSLRGCCCCCEWSGVPQWECLPRCVLMTPGVTFVDRDKLCILLQRPQQTSPRAGSGL